MRWRIVHPGKHAHEKASHVHTSANWVPNSCTTPTTQGPLIQAEAVVFTVTGSHASAYSWHLWPPAIHYIRLCIQRGNLIKALSYEGNPLTNFGPDTLPFNFEGLMSNLRNVVEACSGAFFSCNSWRRPPRPTRSVHNSICHVNCSLLPRSWFRDVAMSLYNITLPFIN